MAKNRPSFRDNASKGLRDTYHNETKLSSNDLSSETVFDIEEHSSTTTTLHSNSTLIDSGLNPYYTYHPKTGKRGGVLGAPRKETKRTQISIGCTEEEKQLYKKAALAEGRKLPDFVNHALQEYIHNNSLDKLI